MKSQPICKKRIRFYPSVLSFLLEKWLTKMSMRGWHLISRKMGIIYCFEKGTPERKEYFVWEPTYTGEGKYSIGMRYPSLIKTYGKKNSPLNRNAINAPDTIIEIDTKKVDIQNDIYYLELKHDRNKLYTLKFLRNFSLFLIVVVFFALIFYFSNN